MGRLRVRRGWLESWQVGLQSYVRKRVVLFSLPNSMFHYVSSSFCHILFTYVSSSFQKASFFV